MLFNHVKFTMLKFHLSSHTWEVYFNLALVIATSPQVSNESPLTRCTTVTHLNDKCIHWLHQ